MHYLAIAKSIVRLDDQGTIIANMASPAGFHIFSKPNSAYFFQGLKGHILQYSVMFSDKTYLET